MLVRAVHRANDAASGDCTERAMMRSRKPGRYSLLSMSITASA